MSSARKPAVRAPVPEPSWRGREPSRRVPLSQASVVEAALRVLDRDGLDGLSMRRVADELETGPASLYCHVRNKEELLQLVYERVNALPGLPEPDPARWAEQLRELADQLRETLRRHRDLGRISLGRLPAGPAFADLTEWLFSLLTPVGVPDRVIAYTCDAFTRLVRAYVVEESLGVASPTGEELAPVQVREMFQSYLASLPADGFPHIHRSLDHLFDPADARFDFSVDLLLRGLQTYADGPEAAPPGAPPGVIRPVS